MGVCFFTGCTTTGNRISGSESDPLEFEHRCRPLAQPPAGTLFPSLSELPQLDPSKAAEVAVATGFSAVSIEAAYASGVLPLLTEMSALEQAVAQHREGAKETLQRDRHRIVERILLVSFQANGVNAEITCEAARAQDLADYLQQENERRARLLTIIAVVTGGIASAVGGGLAIAEHPISEGAAVAVGGVLSTVFGTAALFQDQERELRHPRNLLREIWEGPSNPALFPDVIWRFLNRPLEEAPGTTLRNTIIARWRRDGLIGMSDSAVEKQRVALIFGPGGNYRVEDLRVRVRMLNMLQSQVFLTSEYLEQFLRELLSRPTR